MKKKKLNLFKKVFYTLLFGICSVVFLGSWTYNPQNDTITSDNLLNFNNYGQTINGITYTINNGVISLNGTSTSQVEITCYVSNIPQGILLKSDPVTYSENLEGKINYTYMITGQYWYQSGFGIKTFTLQENLYAFRIIISNNTTITNGILRPMLYNANLVLNNFEPYGTYVNKTEYDSVTEDYNTMVEEYDNLNALYQQLQQDYNTLESNYNDLNSRFSTLTDEYDTLLEEYQDLQNQYNSLQQLYNNLKNAYNPMGMIYNNADAYLFSYSESNTPYYYATSTSNYLAYDEDLEVNDNFNYITPSDFPNIEDYLLNAQNSGVSLYWSIRLDNLTNMPLNIDFVNNEVYSVVLYNTFNNNAQSFEVGQNLYLSVNSQQEFEYNVILIRVYQKTWTWNTISTTNYNILYNQGFNEAMEQANIEINNLKKQIITYQQYIQSMQTNVEVNMRNLIWYIAETPFTSFKTIWNVDFLGLNIASFVSGLLSVWIVLFIIKKIFK